MHRWNHVNYAIPPERMPLVEACIDTVFPWEKFVAKPYLLGYRFGDDLNEGALYFRPVPEAGVIDDALQRLRAQDAQLDGALVRLDEWHALGRDGVVDVIPAMHGDRVRHYSRARVAATRRPAPGRRGVSKWMQRAREVKGPAKKIAEDSR